MNKFELIKAESIEDRLSQIDYREMPDSWALLDSIHKEIESSTKYQQMKKEETIYESI